MAELCAKILVDPAPHISRSYELTGPELKDKHGFAEDYAAALGRQVSYIPEKVEDWNKNYMDSALAEFPHIVEHLKNPDQAGRQRTVRRRHRPTGNPARAPAEDCAVGAGEPSAPPENGNCLSR